MPHLSPSGLSSSASARGGSLKGYDPRPDRDDDPQIAEGDEDDDTNVDEQLEGERGTEPGSVRMPTLIVGTRHHNPQLLQQLLLTATAAQRSPRVGLVRDRNNPRDPSAVRVVLLPEGGNGGGCGCGGISTAGGPSPQAAGNRSIHDFFAPLGSTAAVGGGGSAATPAAQGPGSSAGAAAGASSTSASAATRGDGRTLGYLPSALASHLAPLLDGCSVSARIVVPRDRPPAVSAATGSIPIILYLQVRCGRVGRCHKHGCKGAPVVVL